MGSIVPVPLTLACEVRARQARCASLATLALGPMCTTSAVPRYIQCTGKPNSGCGPELMPSTRTYQSRVASMSSAATRKCSMCDRGMHDSMRRQGLALRPGDCATTIGASSTPCEHAMYVADTKRLTAAGAKQMMASALGLAEHAGVVVTVAIVDAGGNLLLLERME